MLKAAVVILNWNTRNFLEKFLPSVLTNTELEGVKIFVADNGSDDNSVEFLEEQYNDKIGIIKFDKNYGFSQGYNLAFENILAEYYVLLNSDAETTPGWLIHLLQTMESDPLIAACMPKIKAYNQRDFFEYAGAAGGFIDVYGYPFCQGRIFNSIETDYGQYDDVREIFWATGACMVIRSSLYKITGGLDAFFFAHMEEIDFCWRLKNRGYKIIIDPRSEIYHVGGGTLSHRNPRKTYLNFRNNLFLLYKNLPADRVRSVLLTRLFFDCISMLRFLFTGSVKEALAVLRAHVSFWQKIRLYKTFRKDEERYITTFHHREIYPNSIIVAFFLRNKYTFRSLKWNFHRTREK